MLRRLSSQTLAEKTGLGLSGHNTNHPHAIRDDGGRHSRNNSYTKSSHCIRHGLFSYVRWTFFRISKNLVNQFS